MEKMNDKIELLENRIDLLVECCEFQKRRIDLLVEWCDIQNNLNSSFISDIEKLKKKSRSLRNE